MDPFDPLPHAPLPMPKQQLERPGALRALLMRVLSLFVRDGVGPLRREN